MKTRQVLRPVQVVDLVVVSQRGIVLRSVDEPPRVYQYGERLTADYNEAVYWYWGKTNPHAVPIESNDPKHKELADKALKHGKRRKRILSGDDASSHS